MNKRKKSNYGDEGVQKENQKDKIISIDLVDLEMCASIRLSYRHSPPHS